MCVTDSQELTGTNLAGTIGHCVSAAASPRAIKKTWCCVSECMCIYVGVCVCVFVCVSTGLIKVASDMFILWCDMQIWWPLKNLNSFCCLGESGCDKLTFSILQLTAGNWHQVLKILTSEEFPLCVLRCILNASVQTNSSHRENK